MICLGFVHVSACARRIVLGLVESLLRGNILACESGRSAQLQFRVCQPRFRLGDFGGERGDLLRAHTGIDVVAVGGGGGKGRARLPHRRGQLERRQLGDDLAGTDAGAFRTLMVASWPPTSGATRTSVARTMPTMGALLAGCHSTYPTAPAATSSNPSAMIPADLRLAMPAPPLDDKRGYHREREIDDG